MAHLYNKGRIRHWNTIHFYRATSPRRVNQFSYGLLSYVSGRCSDTYSRIGLRGANHSGPAITYTFRHCGTRTSIRNIASLIWSGVLRLCIGSGSASQRHPTVSSLNESVWRISTVCSRRTTRISGYRKKLAHAHELSLKAAFGRLSQLTFDFGEGEIEKFAKTCADWRNDISNRRSALKCGLRIFPFGDFGTGRCIDHLFHDTATPADWSRFRSPLRGHGR